MPRIHAVQSPSVLCTHGDRIEMKKPCLITGFLDCCRLYKFDSSEGVSRGTSPTKTRMVKKMLLYACERNMEAYDGKGEHGSDFIYLNTTIPNLTVA